MVTDLILGTAGHIDHGKTALIKVLTGVDTDRLPEEKKRGITIELGFAELAVGDFRLGIVDVPGHERFVRNMLAGATGMDLALLVVAADDSIKPQTREHLEILRLLDLTAGVIALTKCDLAEPDWIELVEDEVRELAADTFLADAPVLHTSAVTGQGIGELRAALSEAAEKAAAARPRRLDAPFRMAIDRTFTIAGHGTVVTGSASSGTVHAGDELVIEPGHLPVRVRGLENHDRGVDEVHRGQRAAINLGGVHHGQIERGQELATPGHLVPSRLLTARVSLLPSAPRPLKNRARVRVHVGTAELMCSVLLLDRDQLARGETAPLQLFLNQPAVTTWHQPLVIRSESPVATIGGGHVLVPEAEKIRRADAEDLQRLADLSSPDPVVRASAALYFSGLRPWRPEDLTRTAGVDDFESVHAALLQRGDLTEIALTPTRTVRVHALVLERLCRRIETALEKLHREFPLQTTLDRSRLVSRFEYLRADPLIAAVLERMSRGGRIQLSDRGIALAGHGPQLSKGERELMERIIDQYRTAELAPPSVKELTAATERNQASVPQLVALAAADGHLIQITPELYLHTDTERRIRDQLRPLLAASDGLTLSEIRETLGTTRKYAVPLCEYLDRIAFTRRHGDLRVLGEVE